MATKSQVAQAKALQKSTAAYLAKNPAKGTPMNADTRQSAADTANQFQSTIDAGTAAATAATEARTAAKASKKFVTDNTPSGGSSGSGSGGSGSSPTGGQPTVVSTYEGADGFMYSVMSNGAHIKMGQSATGAATSQNRQDAFDLLKDQFTKYGVFKTDATGNYDSASNDLLTTIKSLILGGAGPDTASLTLQQSDAYKARFAGNQERLAKGLNVLSPAEYIATENAYDQIFKAAGVPAGYYSGTAEKAKLIGGDISAAELQDRVNVAAKSIANKDPFYTQQLQNYYGLTAGDMIAHALDPQAALPLLQRQQGAATFGAAASREGLSVNAQTAEQYQALGITQNQAEQGFQAIGTELPTMQKFAALYGSNPSDQQTSLESAVFGGPDAAQQQLKIKRLQQQEVNAFSGSAGVGKGSLQGDLGGTF